jgi:pantothenate kinase
MAVHGGIQTYDHTWLTNLVAKGKSKASCRKTLECSEVSLPVYNRFDKKHTYGSHGNPVKLASS